MHLTGRSERANAAMDLGVVLAFFAACFVCVPYLNPVLRRAHGFRFLPAAALYQFVCDGAAPLLLMWMRRERFADYGYRRRRLVPSSLLGLALAATYDGAVSLHQHAWLWVPLRRQPAVRVSLESGFPLVVLGLCLTVLLWGFLEGFVGVYFARKVNVICKHNGRGWVTPGVVAFAVFNGAVHVLVGQGVEGFLTSFASGYALAVVPAVTQNAWGGSLVQTLTNAVGGR